MSPVLIQAGKQVEISDTGKYCMGVCVSRGAGKQIVQTHSLHHLETALFLLLFDQA